MVRYTGSHYIYNIISGYETINATVLRNLLRDLQEKLLLYGAREGKSRNAVDFFFRTMGEMWGAILLCLSTFHFPLPHNMRAIPSCIHRKNIIIFVFYTSTYGGFFFFLNMKTPKNKKHGFVKIFTAL